jgi:hypothetical protein
MKSCYGYSKGGIVRPSKDAMSDMKHVKQVSDQHLQQGHLPKGAVSIAPLKPKLRKHGGVIGNGSGDTPDSDADDII